MLILLNESGQTGNRLRSLSSLVALGLEMHQDVYCPVVPKEFFEYFKMQFSTKCDIRVNFSCNSFFSEFIKVVRIACGNKDIKLNNGKITIFTDWISFAKPELNQIHYQRIKDFFDFTEEFKKSCKTKMPEKKYDSEMLVGVHLRRGDYQNWKNGAYYFEVEEFIQQMRFLYAENNKIHFVIFSNEIIDVSIFEREPYDVSLMKGNAYEDLCCMSLCDYIIGPPSTFSSWAGYIGNKKLVWMKEKNHCYGFSEFQSVPDSMLTTKAFWKY